MIPIPLVIVGLSGAWFRSFHRVAGGHQEALVLAARQQRTSWTNVASATLTFFGEMFREIIAPIVCVLLAIRAMMAVYEWVQRNRTLKQDNDHLLSHLRNVDLMMFQYNKENRTVTIGTIQKNPYTLRVVTLPTDKIIYPSKSLAARSFS